LVEGLKGPFRRERGIPPVLRPDRVPTFVHRPVGCPAARGSPPAPPRWCGTRRSGWSGTPALALASRGEPARADRGPVGEVRMSDEDPAPHRRRGSRGVRKPGRWTADARAGACSRRTRDRPDRGASVGSTKEMKTQCRGASAVAREGSRGCGGGGVGPEIERMLMIRPGVGLAAGDARDGPETPGNAAVGQGADANDGRPRGALVRGVRGRSPGGGRTKGGFDASRQEEQRQQASKYLGARELGAHRQPHTGEQILSRLYGAWPDPSNNLGAARRRAGAESS